MALARTSVDKFVLLAGDAASHPGFVLPSPLRPLPESIPLNSSSRTKAFFEFTSYIMPDPIAGRKTLEALQAFDASEHVLLVLDHDTSLRESRNALSLARWEELRRAAQSQGRRALAFLGRFSVGRRCVVYPADRTEYFPRFAKTSTVPAIGTAYRIRRNVL